MLTSAQEVESLRGNYISTFIKDYTIISALQCELTRYGVTFKCNKQHQAIEESVDIGTSDGLI